ncbi:MAG: polysaccharide deacetylase family protein [Acidobacteriota bacterium]
MRVCLTIDVEPDCPPFLATRRGIVEALPWLLDVLASASVPATFFVTGDIARRHAPLVRAVVEHGHELGCHGDDHEDYTRLTEALARRALAAACESLRAFGPVVSFRAPYLRLPATHVPLVADAGFDVDSSEARYKGLGVRPHRVGRLTRIPASITSSLLRLPTWLLDPIIASLRDPVVLFVHPWEFVDLRRAPIRWDCRAGTGEHARRSLVGLLARLRARDARFMRLRDCSLD